MDFPPNVFPVLSLCLCSCIPPSIPPSSGGKRKAERGKQGVFLTLGNLRSLQVKVKYLGEVDFEKSRTFPTQKIFPAWKKVGAGEIVREEFGGSQREGFAYCSSDSNLGGTKPYYLERFCIFFRQQYPRKGMATRHGKLEYRSSHINFLARAQNYQIIHRTKKF